MTIFEISSRHIYQIQSVNIEPPIRYITITDGFKEFYNQFCTGNSLVCIIPTERGTGAYIPEYKKCFNIKIRLSLIIPAFIPYPPADNIRTKQYRIIKTINKFLSFIGVTYKCK